MCKAEEKHGGKLSRTFHEATAYSFRPRQARLYTPIRPFGGANRADRSFRIPDCSYVYTILILERKNSS
jgi:hypothetical protein